MARHTLVDKLNGIIKWYRLRCKVE